MLALEDTLAIVAFDIRWIVVGEAVAGRNVVGHCDGALGRPAGLSQERSVRL